MREPDFKPVVTSGLEEFVLRDLHIFFSNGQGLDLFAVFSGYLRANSKLICPQQWAVEIGILTDGFLLLGMNNQREWDGLPLPRNCGRGWVDGISVGGAGGFVKKVH